MWMRFLPPMFLVALATPCHADDKAISDIGEGIASYRLSAPFCHWPIPPNINRVLYSDEIHFSGKNPEAFSLGVKNGTDRFHLLTSSLSNYCKEVKSSRDVMTRSLEKRAK